MQCLLTEVKNTAQLQTRGSFTLILQVNFIAEDPTVTVKCRTTIQVKFLYFNLGLNVSFGFISFSLISFGFFRFVLLHFVSIRVVSFGFVSFCLISFGFVSFLFRFALYRYPCLIASRVLSHPYLLLANLLMIIMPILSSHFAKSQTGDASSSRVPALTLGFLCEYVLTIKLSCYNVR